LQGRPRRDERERERKIWPWLRERDVEAASSAWVEVEAAVHVVGQQRPQA
jgi:hypothetical protein